MCFKFNEFQAKVVYNINPRKARTVRAVHASRFENYYTNHMYILIPTYIHLRWSSVGLQFTYYNLGFKHKQYNVQAGARDFKQTR